jgi:rhodanese-related sulfurtransferase
MHALVILASFNSLFFGLFGVNWEDIDSRITEEFPQVELLSTDSLLNQMQERLSPMLIDVREIEEYKISHLQTAVNVKTAEEIAQLITDKSTPIVVYCSVGYRSAGVAAGLQGMGYENVLSLQHSIFEWANKNYPMIDDQGDTDKVHPFNRAWGALVASRFHQYP